MFYFEDYYMWFRMIADFTNNMPDYLVSMNVDYNYFERRTGLRYFGYYMTFLKMLKKMINFYIIYLLFN